MREMLSLHTEYMRREWTWMHVEKEKADMSSLPKVTKKKQSWDVSDPSDVFQQKFSIMPFDVLCMLTIRCLYF